MQTVALVAGIVALFAVTAVLEAMRLRRAESREHARERQAWEVERARLVDQVCHLAEKPWSPPPIRTPDKTDEQKPDPERELARGW